MKKVLGYGLLAFVGISLAFAFSREGRSGPESGPGPRVEQAPPGESVPGAARTAAPKAAAPKPAPMRQPLAKGTVIARYCHGHARCSSCVKIEQYSREAIETGLRKALDSGRLRFETVNVDEPAHRHYIQDYGLYTKSLVLIAETGGKEVRHKVLNDVWNHLSDKTAFMAYVRSETEGFLKQP